MTDRMGMRSLPMDPVCEAVLSQFRGMDECPRDWPDDWRPLMPPRIRRKSTIHRLGSKRSGKSICVKVLADSVNGTEHAIRMHDVLSYYHARSDLENGYTVPKSYACIPEYRAVIMEWFEGVTFTRVLKRGLPFTRRRHEYLRKGAGWLRWFHSQSEISQETLPCARPLKGILRVFEGTVNLQTGATAHDSTLRRHLQSAGAAGKAIGRVKADCAILHGDFKPSNLLIAPSGVVAGIDIIGERRGPVGHDICRFLTDTDFYQSFRRRSFAVTPGSGSNDFEVFLGAYGPRAGEVADSVFVYRYFLAILSVLVHQRRRFAPTLAYRIRLAVFRRIASQLEGAIGRAHVSR